MASAREPLGSASNNVAEYSGIRACLVRAVARANPANFVFVQDRHVRFEVDSQIVARHLAHYNPTTCKSPALRALYEECLTLCARLTAFGVRWDVMHIYREFNCSADALANEAIDLGG